jgi:FdhE protein
MELDRLAKDKPAFATPILWLRDSLPLLAEDGAVVAPAFEDDYIREKAVGGIPLLRGERPTFDLSPIRRRWNGLCDTLRAYQPESAEELFQAANSTRFELAEAIAALLAGDADGVRTRALAAGLDPALAATLFRFTLFPDLVAMNGSIAAKNVSWLGGYCPTCGSWPLLGEFRGIDQQRRLRCGLCAADWEAPRLRCPFCGCSEHDRLGFLHQEGEETRLKAATCDACHGYVKMVSTLSALSPLGLLVADVETLHLDLAAAERGLGGTG